MPLATACSQTRGNLVTRQDGISSMLGRMAVSRRTMIVGTASAVAFAVPFAQSAWGDVSLPPSVLGAVFDHRFAQSRAFAARARSLGIKPLGFTADMSGLWFGELLSALRADPRPIVGLTSRRALFCFEQLAWDVGMRVRFRIEHLENRDGFQHIPSDASDSSALASLRSAGDAFGDEALDAMLRCHSAWGNCTHATVPEIQELRREPLTTWAIAPLHPVKAA